MALAVRLVRRINAVDDPDRNLLPARDIVDVRPEYRAVYQPELLPVKQVFSVLDREFCLIGAQSGHGDCAAVIQARVPGEFLWGLTRVGYTFTCRHMIASDPLC